VWRRHNIQMKLRQWSTDEDIIIDPTTTTTIDRSKCSSTLTSSFHQGSQILRRSSRLKQTVKRLIEEI
jgi:hypothetical protein